MPRSAAIANRTSKCRYDPFSAGDVMAAPVRFVCAVMLLAAVHSFPAAAAVPSGTWMFASRVALQIFDCAGLLCGRIVWLLRPDNPAGQPDIDYLNPDPALRQRHFVRPHDHLGYAAQRAGSLGQRLALRSERRHYLQCRRGADVSGQHHGKGLSRDPPSRPHRNSDP
jgi:hypothetical protein